MPLLGWHQLEVHTLGASMRNHGIIGSGLQVVHPNRDCAEHRDDVLVSRNSGGTTASARVRPDTRSRSCSATQDRGGSPTRAYQQKN